MTQKLRAPPATIHGPPSRKDTPDHIPPDGILTLNWNRKPSRRIRLRIEVLERRALLSAGALDTSYNGSGTVLTATNSGFGSNPTAVAIQYDTQNDRKSVVVGTATIKQHNQYQSVMAVIRYNTNGTRDATFGTNGEVDIITSTQGEASVQAQSPSRTPSAKARLAGQERPEHDRWRGRITRPPKPPRGGERDYAAI
jgi:hypothetical protein